MTDKVLSMSEIELKFQIPASQLKAVRLAFGRKQPTVISLHAKYFDTADHYLQQHHITLRQRLENDIWIQTLKAPKNTIERLEIETKLGTQEPTTIDLQCSLQHQKIQKKLAPLLQSLKDPLQVQFETQIKRQLYVQKLEDSEIEVAFDQGKVMANQQSLLINEIEFELKQGNIHDLLASIQPWIEKYQIWLDSNSKATKGQMLQQSLETVPAQYQTELRLNSNVSVAQALPKIVSNCLDHLLPNVSAIANQQSNALHVHQARVAIRRLRSALRTFESLFDCETQVWQTQLAELFKHLGGTRDRDALTESLIPQLIQAGSPITALPMNQTQINQEISKIFRAPETTKLWLKLIEFSHSAQTNKKKLKSQMDKKINKMHLKICRSKDLFQQMPAEEKHQLRKRVKRLRYSIEFIATLYPKKVVKQYLKALKPLQDSLGRFNDLSVADTLFKNDLKQHPETWFVVGWIAAEQASIEQKIQQDLAVFSQVPCFWSCHTT